MFSLCIRGNSLLPTRFAAEAAHSALSASSQPEVTQSSQRQMSMLLPERHSCSTEHKVVGTMRDGQPKDSIVKKTSKIRDRTVYTQTEILTERKAVSV